jgi:hypothetical protein
MTTEFGKGEGWEERVKLHLLIISFPYAECG